MHLLYIHGFLSSPLSRKAVQVRNWLKTHRPEIQYHCPALTPYPAETRQTLEGLVESLLPQRTAMIGSSLGGYWATWLVERYGLRAVLVNPAVRPSMFEPDYLDVELKNYHTDETYTLGEKDLAELLAVDIPDISLRDSYWLMVQSGDETLDYRHAVKKYRGSRQLVEDGGDHSFQGFERHLADIMDFLFCDE